MAIRLVSKAELIRLNNSARRLDLPNTLDPEVLADLYDDEVYQVTEPMPRGEHVQVKVRLTVYGVTGLLSMTREDFERLPLAKGA